MERDDGSGSLADKREMKRAQGVAIPAQTNPIPWAMQMNAISRLDPSRTVKSLTGAILACGGWVLSRSVSDTGVIEILFEFERRSCLEIYSILIAAGVELSRSAHIGFTELCQCTRMVREECREEIVSVDLEVQSSPGAEARESSLTFPH
jgi:hypothetical protein